MDLSGFHSVPITAIYCALCGEMVPMENKWFTRLYQRKVKDLSSFMIYLGYICPKWGKKLRQVTRRFRILRISLDG